MRAINTSKNPNICVITSAYQRLTGETILTNFLKILSPLSNKLFVITGYYPKRPSENIHIVLVTCDVKKESMATRALKFLRTQLTISFTMFKLFKDINIVIFFTGGGTYVLPMLCAKVFGKRTIIILTESAVNITKNAYNERISGKEKFIFLWIMGVLEKLNCTLSDQIIVYSPNIIKEWNLEKCRDKISITHKHFIDFGKFKIEKTLSERNNLVGYIGRLSEEKGTLNFVEAIPEILPEKDGVNFLIGGDGQLREGVEKYLDKENLNGKVKLLGWILHDELPDYLNQLRLVVLPSYTEGLPNIMLEAMACGTAVLATPVGAVPDIITDGKTGFIMENNSPECIAENVLRALEYPHLEGVAKRARALVEREFTFERAVESYRNIFINLMSKD